MSSSPGGVQLSSSMTGEERSFGDGTVISLPTEENLMLPSADKILSSPMDEKHGMIPSFLEEEAKAPAELGVLPEMMASVWTIEACPSTGLINSLCNNQNRVVRDATLGSRAILSGGGLAGKVNSQGFVSQVTIQTDAVFTGGTLSGYVFNQGTLVDITFVGAMLQGGILAGTIRNESRVGGILVDVTFAPHAHLQGGKLQGQIRGDQEAPALLEEVKILKGSMLSGVKLGHGVLLEEGVQIE